MSSLKVGVFVDCNNLYRNGGFRMEYDVLRHYAGRDGNDPVIMNAYVNHDNKRSRSDMEYKKKSDAFYNALREIDFKVILRETRWYTDDSGHSVSKNNTDMQIAVDMLTYADRLDRMLLVSGDPDFIPLVHVLRNKGVRIEVLAFDNVSYDLRNTADSFTSGYLIPNLLKVSTNEPEWGDENSRVRGTCYFYDKNKGFGYLRYLEFMSNLTWCHTPRYFGDSVPYATAFFHGSKLPESIVQHLPSKDHVFEFKLVLSDKNRLNDSNDGIPWSADNIKLVTSI